ncbi:mitochondrial amidoxime reducing component 2 [Protopterus annectens]|uniref:mitochondrial amidoxime reducing component 2 n=1 Tax=Protopterus annectens TaxID=7888 RepID=UPI001CFC1674|nr:mitochondrial amidoxime reducing component 2 [Protopterus annectens]
MLKFDSEAWVSLKIRDRHWIVTQENGQKVTARQEPRLVLISVSCENGHLILNAPDMEELRVPVKLPESNLVKTIRVWGSDIPGRDCGDEASHWITTFLKSSQPYRLAQFEPNMKYRNAKEKNPYFRPSDKIVYPDASPILLITEASLEDLNTRLEKKVQMRNFRPVIVVSGCSAFEEDSWDHIQIGSVILVRVMACPRCILTTVNPDTGVIDRIEPLETLKSYRMSDPSEKHIYKSAPLFGQFYAVDMTGHIKVGDAVYRLL